MTQPDFDKMSNEELRAMALQWANGEAPQAEDEQPRDEHGKFVKKDEAQVETPAGEEAEEEVVYERTIDLGDGAGVQIFQGKTMEELVDKLATAQEHASRKIREQQAQLRQPAKQKQIESTSELENLSEEEKFLLQQEMLSDPVKAISRFVKKAVVDHQSAEEKRAAAEKDASDAFVANTSEYFVSPKNGERMVKYLQTYQLEVTQENLEKAFKDLNSSGLLESKPAEAKETPVVAADETETEARIEPKPSTQTVVRRRVVGGVSVKRSAPKPTPTPGLSEDQLYKMPLNELEELTRKALIG